MGLSTIKILCLAFVALWLPCHCDEAEIMTSTSEQTAPNTTAANHILYLMHTGESAKALQLYQTYRQENGANDFELIEQIGLILLDQGFRTHDPETQLMTTFGAGISMNEKSPLYH